MQLALLELVAGRSGVAARRTVAHFGHDYGYDARAIAPGAPLPEWLLPLRERAAELAGVTAAELSHALIARYPAGAGIGWHRDAPMFERVVGVSLLSACTLRFRKREGERFVRHALALPPRSAYALSGAARWTFQHGISRMPALRYSITFRTLCGERASTRGA